MNSAKWKHRSKYVKFVWNPYGFFFLLFFHKYEKQLIQHFCINTHLYVILAVTVSLCLLNIFFFFGLCCFNRNGTLERTVVRIFITLLLGFYFSPPSSSNPCVVHVALSPASAETMKGRERDRRTKKKKKNYICDRNYN